MPTPAKGYYLDGERVPGTTTILSRFKDSGGLIHWAWDVGRRGEDYRDVRDKAAGIGTIAHEMVECRIRGKVFDPALYPQDSVDKAARSFAAFEEWAGSTNLTPTETEVGLVSRLHRYGGTLDAMLVNGKLALGDWKTSNSVYGDYLCQLAAYGQLWTENRPDQPITGGFHLMRFDKDHGDFHHHWFTELDEALEMFLCLRRAYELDKVIKKRVT